MSGLQNGRSPHLAFSIATFISHEWCDQFGSILSVFVDYYNVGQFRRYWKFCQFDDFSDVGQFGRFVSILLILVILSIYILRFRSQTKYLACKESERSPAAVRSCFEGKATPSMIEHTRQLAEKDRQIRNLKDELKRSETGRRKTENGKPPAHADRSADFMY